MNLAVDLGGLELKNPVTTASGTFAAGMEFSQFLDVSKLGAVTTKGVSLNGWPGNETPRICETPSGMLNSIGLQNPGVEHLKQIELPWLERVGAKAIVNVCGHSEKEYLDVIEALEGSYVDAYELNVSCPNVDAGGMSIGVSTNAVEKLTSMCKNMTSRPIIVKLTPNVTDIAEIAKAAESGGANAVSLINTVLGMAIDARTRKPKLAKVLGGLSGPCVKPIALRAVWQVYQATTLPIVGMGGITCAQDAIEFILAGATAVAVGTANFIDPTATIGIISGIEDYCTENGIDDINELRGALIC